MQLRLRIILLFIGSVLTILSNFLIVSDANQFKLLLFSMVLLGVPHGALDLYIEGKDIHSKYQKSNQFLWKYLLNILLYASLWYLSPIIALIIFIFITAYHFGEIDWMGKSDTWTQKFVYSLLGMCWILYFLSINISSALKIFLYVGQSNVTEQQWLHIASLVSPIALILIIATYIVLLLKRKYFYYQSNHFYFSVIQLIILLAICHFSTLWVGFGFYFGLWHSILSFDKIRSSFSMPDTLKSWGHLLKQAMPFSIMAWIGMLFIMFMFYSSKNSTSLVTLLFITLSVLTLPHLQVFTKLKLRSSEASS